MAVYPLTIDSDANVTASLKSALSTAGILTTTHYETTTRLIVTTTRSNKVIRFVVAAKQIRTYIGDAWKSGDAVTNEVSIRAGYDNLKVPTGAAVIVTADLLAVVLRIDTSRVEDVLFCRMDTAATEYLAMGWYTNDSSSVIHDTTNNAQAEIPSFNRNIVSTAGYYYQHNVIVTTASNILQASAVKGLKHVAMPQDLTVAHTVFGDDVVIAGGGTNGLSTYFSKSFLIVDGNSWAPA